MYWLNFSINIYGLKTTTTTTKPKGQGKGYKVEKSFVNG